MLKVYNLTSAYVFVKTSQSKQRTHPAPPNTSCWSSVIPPASTPDHPDLVLRQSLTCVLLPWFTFFSIFKPTYVFKVQLELTFKIGTMLKVASVKYLNDAPSCNNPLYYSVTKCLRLDNLWGEKYLFISWFCKSKSIVSFSAQLCKGFTVHQTPVRRLNARACRRVTKWQDRWPETQSQTSWQPTYNNINVFWGWNLQCFNHPPLGIKVPTSLNVTHW